MKKFIVGILTCVWLWFSTIFAQNVLPDEVKISVKDPIIVWEAINLKVTVMKNWSKMTSYDWTILMQITEQNWTTRLKDIDVVLPNLWMYSFLPSDLWEKEFQKWLEIKKDGTFYIEVQDLNDDSEKVLWRQLIHVIKQNWENDVKEIEIQSPYPNANLIGEKVEIIWRVNDLPNSDAIIYLDDKPVWIAKVDSDWIINYVVWNTVEWLHTILVEIPDLEWNIMWRSNKISFNVGAPSDNGIRNVLVNPETWLMVWDMTNITVYTDELVESIKLKMSDRPENDSIVMNKNWIWEFNQNVWLIGSWEVNLSFDVSSYNNTVNQTYSNYKKIFVWDLPSIYDVNVETDVKDKYADVSRKVTNDSIVSSYLIDWWVEGSDILSWKEWSDKLSFRFSDVPYDTVINLNITPYRSNSTNHWAASKTIQFVISKTNQDICGNWVCGMWENSENCPQDCETQWTRISTCTPQSVSVRRQKIWDNYYLMRDKVEWVSKYVVYSSSYANGKDKVKVYETTDTSYEYPFDHESENDIFMYFWVVWVCESGEELELTWATKVQVWPAENFFLLLCLTLLIYAWIKLFRQTEV